MAEIEGVSCIPKTILYASNETRSALATCSIENKRDGKFSTDWLMGRKT